MDYRSEQDVRPASQAAQNDAEAYALGYTLSEFKRLEMQANFMSDLTADMLRRAGLERGMKVLDLGCGVGDVSLLAGEIVGPSGGVLGIDRSKDAIDIAEQRAIQAGQCFWVRFAEAELASFAPAEKFDAIIGRFVLMYLPDAAGTLRRLSRYLNPNGIIAFQEMCMPLGRSVPATPLLSQVIDWIVETFERTGFETDMGGKLYQTYLAAGFSGPQMISAGRTEGGEQSLAYDYVARTAGSLLPVMEKTGVATAAELGIDDLAQRLRAEALAHRSCIMLPPLVGAWTRVE